MENNISLMIRWIVVFLIAGLSGLFDSIMAQEQIPIANVLKQIRDRKSLIVGMESKSPPMNYINIYNNRDGFDYMFAIEIAKRIGAHNVEVKESKYETLPDLLRNQMGAYYLLRRFYFIKMY